ncbi:MAG: PVC-type heme-binding CxxCH protein, partial [Planctomycetota bacterium]
ETPQGSDADQIIASGKLPRFQPLSPKDAQRSFEVANGFRVELVAAEPLVVDPVAFCFDERGRLIVVEMRGYSERAESKTGRVRRLTDTDADGLMDQAETLIEGLEWPTAVACWGEGIVIGVAPDILYLPLSEEGEHGPAEVLFSGFGKTNVQGLFNSFQWGPDLRLHCATSSSGAIVTGKTVDGVVRIGRRDFTIDFHSRKLTPVNGGGQHGMSFDRWGNKFVCSNSDHLQQVLLLPNVPGRSFTFEEPPLRRSIAVDGPQAKVYRSSPIEPWRILRTHMRVNGLAKGPIEGGGQAAGYFTGATGIHLYEGDQWPQDEGRGLALICDVGSNLIHRKQLTQHGDLWFRGQRRDPKSEFLRSTDTWFRPVQLGGGPDGALYVADMYREVIEHPKSLPPNIKSQVDLNSGNDRGRIWRIVSTKSRPRSRIIPAFDSNDAFQLVRYLGHENQWHRRTAARLLMQQRKLPDDVIREIRNMALHSAYPEPRMEALAVLGAIPDGLDRNTASRSAIDTHPYVRRRILMLAIEQPKRFAETGWFNLRLGSLDSVGPDYMMVYGSAALAPDTDTRMSILESYLQQRHQGPWSAWAVQGSITPDLLKAEFAQLFKWVPRLTILQTLASGDPVLVQRLIHRIEKLDRAGTSDAIQLIAGITDRIRRDDSTAPLQRWILDSVDPAFTQQATQGSLPKDAEAKLRLIGWALEDGANDLLNRLLSPNQSPATQRMAIVSLASDDRQLNRALLDKIENLTPSVQTTAWETLGQQRSGLLVIASAVDRGQLAPEAIPASVRNTMRLSRDARVKSAVQGLEGQSPHVDASPYFQTLKTSGDAIAGESVFKQHCAACHAPQDRTNQVGPPLKSIVDKTPEQILISILEPNREVDPKYYRVQVLTDSGRIQSGILLDESDSGLSLVDERGKRFSIPRDRIESLRTVKQSLMPTNLAKEISPTQMRDLISFLKK